MSVVEENTSSCPMKKRQGIEGGIKNPKLGEVLEMEIPSCLSGEGGCGDTPCSLVKVERKNPQDKIEISEMD